MAERNRRAGAGAPGEAVEEQEQLERAGEPGEKKGKPVRRKADAGVKLNVGELVEQLLEGVAGGSLPSTKLLFGLAEGKIAMEEIGSQKKIRSLAMVLSAAPAWEESAQVEPDEA